MRSAWGVDTLTLATTDSAGAGAGMQGRGARRLPDTDAAKECAPASAGEASMALLCDSAARLLSSSRALRHLILSAVQCLAREITRGPLCFALLLTTQTIKLKKKRACKGQKNLDGFLSKLCASSFLCAPSAIIFWVPNGRKFEAYKSFKDIA
jgi:hypothetical protein